MNLRKKIAKTGVVKLLASLKITVTCLFLLFILTFWGTVDQVENGLYHAQDQFFHSFYFLAFGFLPFPGAQLILWVLFINLVSAMVVRFVFKLSHIGILIIHFGLISYFISAFVTLHVVEESQVTLKEGDRTNVSSAYREWELSVWKQAPGKRKIVAYDTNQLRREQALDFAEYGFSAISKLYFVNAQPFLDKNSTELLLNHSGINVLKKLEPEKEPEKNLPGAIFLIKPENQKEFKILLSGYDPEPTQIKIGNETFNFMLRRKRLPMPVTVALKDFIMEKHPNTDIARSYESEVTVKSQDLERDVVISMNQPLRFHSFTFYQASYAIDRDGREYSTLAVVKNSGRILPYVSSLITFCGLLIHFLLAGWNSRQRLLKVTPG